MISKRILLILLLFFILKIAIGQIELIPAEKNKLIAHPGKVLTFAITIKNDSPEAVILEATIDGPSAWRLISGKGMIELKAGTTELRLLSFLIPANTQTGSYDLSYIVNAINTTESYSAQTDLEIEVPSIFEISVSPFEVPDFVLSGEAFEAKFLVKNLSNKAQHVSFDAHKCELIGERRIYIKANGSKIISVRANTLVDAFQVSRQSFRLEAWLSQNADISDQSYQSVKVIPINQAVTDGQYKIPSHLRLKYIVRDNNARGRASGFQGEFYSRGFLDEAKEKEVGLQLRGPDRFNLSLLGLYEEYYAYYKSPGMSVFVGDKTYKLSPLTEYARYGRGAEANITLNKLQLGGFYQRPRFFPDIKEGYASYFRYNASPNNEVGLNFYRRTSTASERIDYFVSGLAKVKPMETTELTIEFAKDLKEQSASSALFLQLYSQPVNFIKLHGNVLYAGKNYKGYYSNVLNYMSSLNIRATKKIHLSVYAQQNQRNITQDTLYGLAPSIKRYRAGINYFVNKNTTIKAQVNQHFAKDLNPTEKFDYQFKFVRLQLNQKINRWRFIVAGDFGQTENFKLPVGENIFNTLRAFLTTSYKLSTRHQFRVFANYFDQSKISEFEIEKWIYGLSINSYLTNTTFFTITISKQLYTSGLLS